MTVLVSSCSLAFPVHESDTPASDAGSDAESSVGGDYAAAVMADSPELYLRFGEKSGPTAKDEMGHYDGTYPGGGITYGAPGALNGDPDTAIAFDGTDVISMPPGLDFPGMDSFTIEVWANPTSYNGFGFAIDHDDYAHDRAGFDLILNADHTQLERWTGPSAVVVTTDGPLSLGGYHHLAVTFDGTDMRLYVDGQLRDRRSNVGSLARTGVGWTIGGQNCQCSPNRFKGALDELAVYSKALPEDRIAAHYQAAHR